MEEEEASSNERHVPCRMQHNDHVIFWDKNKSFQGSRHEPTSTWICLSCFFVFLYQGKSPCFTTICENTFFSKNETSESKTYTWSFTPIRRGETPSAVVFFCRRIFVFHGKPPNSSPQQIIRSGEDGYSSKWSVWQLRNLLFSTVPIESEGRNEGRKIAIWGYPGG